MNIKELIDNLEELRRSKGVNDETEVRLITPHVARKEVFDIQDVGPNLQDHKVYVRPDTKGVRYEIVY